MLRRNISGNKLKGPIPQSLKDKSDHGSLLLRFSLISYTSTNFLAHLTVKFLWRSLSYIYIYTDKERTWSFLFTLRLRLVAYYFLCRFSLSFHISKLFLMVLLDHFGHIFNWCIPAFICSDEWQFRWKPNIMSEGSLWRKSQEVYCSSCRIHYSCCGPCYPLKRSIHLS